MDDLNVLKAASKVSHGAGVSLFSLKLGSRGKHGDDADEQLLLWRRINDEANAAYAALLAHASKAFGYHNLPAASPELLQKAMRYATHVADQATFTEIGQVIEAYLINVTHRDDQCRQLVGAYVGQMRELVAQSRVVLRDEHATNNQVAPQSAEQPQVSQPDAQTPGQASHQALNGDDRSPTLTGFIPRQPSAEVTQLEEQLQLTQTLISNAQARLNMLSDHLSRQPQRYVAWDTYETLLGDWNATQKRQYDHDEDTIKGLIKIIADIRSQYGIGDSTPSTPVIEAQASFERAINALTLRIEALLDEQFAIARMRIAAGAPFNPKTMTVDRGPAIATHESQLDGKVARVVAHGYSRRRAEGAEVVFQRATVVPYALADQSG